MKKDSGKYARAKSTVKRRIDAWDPMDLLDDAPEDEYDTEIAKVARAVFGGFDIDGLAAEISKVFRTAFELCSETEEWTPKFCRPLVEDIYLEYKREKQV